MTFFVDLLAATLRNATPLVYGTVGETYTERSGVLNLGIEGTMYAGAFTGFAAAWATGSPLIGLIAAIAVGVAAGAVMALMTVTFGANQHVSGIGWMRWRSPPWKISRFANSLNPMSPMVRPMPETCWLAPNVTVMRPMTAPAAMPTAIAATSPSSGEPVAHAVAKPAKAPAYIVPSIPRLSTPLRSV